MKALLVFLSCYVPLALGLWFIDAGDRNADRLPDRPPALEEAVLSGDDFAGPHGVTPFVGKLRKLEQLDLRILDEGYFKLYLQLGRVSRVDGRPRIEKVRALFFDPPVDGQPQLRVTIEAPYVATRLDDLLRPSGDEPRLIELDGGVIARDPAGRQVAELERARFDAQGRSISSDGPFVLRAPDRDAELRGVGLEANMSAGTVRIEKQVVAFIGAGGKRARLSCDGPGTVAEDRERDEIVVTMNGNARIETDVGVALCPKIVAIVVQGEDGPRLKRAQLLGGVELQPAPDTAQGVESIHFTSATIEEEERLVCVGPVKVVWRGQVTALGLGERTLDIEAGEAIALLRRTDAGRLELEEARLRGGLRATDRDGGGTLSARTVTWIAWSGILEASGAVKAKAPEGTLETEHLRLESPDNENYKIALKGRKSISYVADGKLGPLGEAARGTLRLTCTGPLRVSGNEQSARFEATRSVVASIDDTSRLECEELSIDQVDGKLASFVARRNVLLEDKPRGAEARGDEVSYDGAVARMAGAPAVVKGPDGAKVTARKLVFRDDQTFEADGDVFVHARLARGAGKTAPWTIRCGRARGALSEEGEPLRVDAAGGVSADGPEHQSVRGDSFSYVAETGKALLLGKPARLQRGEDIAVTAGGFDLVLADGLVKDATSRGRAHLDYKTTAKDERFGFTRWRVVLDGPAAFDGNQVVVAAGGSIEAFDSTGKLALAGNAKRVVVPLADEKGKMRAQSLQATNGVVLESFGEKAAKVTADRLVFRAGSREVDVYGNARVEGQGWPRTVSFEHVVFTVEEKGIDLKRASQIEVK